MVLLRDIVEQSENRSAAQMAAVRHGKDIACVRESPVVCAQRYGFSLPSFNTARRSSASSISSNRRRTPAYGSDRVFLSSFLAAFTASEILVPALSMIKLAGVLVGGSAADRVDSAVEHSLYKALREVKPLKLLSELLFGSRFILLRGGGLSRGAFSSLCGFFSFLCDVFGNIRGFKVFPREPLHHKRKAVFARKLAARAGASEYLSFSRKIRRCVVWIFPAAAAFPENQRFVRCFAQVGEFAQGAYFFAFDTAAGFLARLSV